MECSCSRLVHFQSCFQAMNLRLRQALIADIDVLPALMNASVRGLQVTDYTGQRCFELMAGKAYKLILFIVKRAYFPV